jgi:hypothetical protein
MGAGDVRLNATAQHADPPRPFALPRPHLKRPRDGCAAKPPDQVAPLPSRPSKFAFTRLGAALWFDCQNKAAEVCASPRRRRKGCNQAKKVGTKVRPDPLPQGKRLYAGLAGVFFNERYTIRTMLSSSCCVDPRIFPMDASGLSATASSSVLLAWISALTR